MGGQKVNFNGRTYTIPTVASRVTGGIDNAGVTAESGKICIIDTGIGAGYGGGVGNLSSTLRKREMHEFLQTFNSVSEMQSAIRGGIMWDLAKYLYNPSTRFGGASTVYYVRAAQTTAGSKVLTFTDTNHIDIGTKEEGLFVNGDITTITGKLLKGYGIKLVAGINDTAKFKIQFWVGTYRGADTDGYYYDGVAPATAANNPMLVTESAELTTIAEFKAWALTDSVFQQYFEIKATTSASGTIATADLTLLAGFQVIASGAETYGSTALQDALDNLTGLDNSLFLCTDSANDAYTTNNLAILAFVKNQANFKKFLIIAGQDTTAKFNNGATSSVYAAQTLNSEYCHVVHGAITESYILNSAIKVYKKALYKAAMYCGLKANLEPQVSLTYKSLRIENEYSQLSDTNKAIAIENGVIITISVPQLGNVICQDVNTIQINTQMINQDGSSPEGSIMRITAQLNRELQESAAPLFIGGNGYNVNANTLITFTKNYLKTKLVEVGVKDNLILSFQDITAVKQGTAWYVTYKFIPNSPVNKLFFTGIMIG